MDTTLRRPRRRHQQKPQKLEDLFGQERAFCFNVPPVVLLNSGGIRRRDDRESVGVCEEKWRFQADVLRAECKFLRMERHMAVKRLERERVFMDNTLKSALHSLISARGEVGEGQNVGIVLEEEIQELAKKLGELQTSSKTRERRDPDLLKRARSSSNFDRQANLIKKKLEKIGGLSGEEGVIDVQEVVKASLTNHRLIKEDDGSSNGSRRLADVENLRRKMESLSEGRLLKKMEDEYGSMLCRTANISAANSQRYEFLDLSSWVQESLQVKKPCEKKLCAGHCKVIVRRIMEQVRVETEQWSQMQEMLEQVKEEMEQLQVSRDFWEGQALGSQKKVQSHNSKEWKQIGEAARNQGEELENSIISLQEQVKRIETHRDPDEITIKELAHVSQEVPHLQEKEKRVLTCRAKGKIQAEEICRKTIGRKNVINKGRSEFATPKRQPFREIGNLYPVPRLNS